ncbi:MAG: PIN domain-containing protein [Armatimonadota bacterium]
MRKRTFWTLFTLVFMVAGAAIGAWFAGIYVRNLGMPNGRFFWMDVSALDPLSKVERILATSAFAIGGMLVGFLTSTVLYAELQRLRRGIETMSVQDKIAVVAGLLIGLLLTVLISISLQLPTVANLAIAVFFCYIGVTATLSMTEQIRLYFPGAPMPNKIQSSHAFRPKILDTNVIIDGRIADICKAGFVDGPIYIPRFVLEELQQIADSSDSLKRARGRRGLDILNQMQQEMSLQIETYDGGNGNNYPDEVDAKLVELAKDLGGVIVTNDYNLNKVAGLHGIKVLNVNELANALKPVVLPGEVMTTMIIKEGKEQNQGVGYLDDGTMIVVEGGRNQVGATVDVMVTSVLQTAAGKMIFANLTNDQPEEDSTIDRNIRSYSGGRPRKKIR